MSAGSPVGAPHPGPGLVFFPQTEQAQQGFAISGVTKDSTGAILGGCTVDLFSTLDDVRQATVVSDPTTGAYMFFVGSAQPYYCVAYLPGTPDVAGTTVNTLIAVPV